MNRNRLSTLCEMLTYARPYGSATERAYILRYIASLPGATEDPFGNWIVRIGDSPILWSSHTDTVHRFEGRQSVRVNEHEQTIRLSRRAKRNGSSCLGADDTVGNFLMREMILANVPGLYVFHYGEEVGGIGSGSIAEYTPELLRPVCFAIALDRQGTGDVITSQFGGRCASDNFARSLARQLPGAYGLAKGTFTDTEQYAEIVPECSNISVGYYHAHTPREFIDYAHVSCLLDSLLTLDPSSLVCERDPRVARFTWTRPDPIASPSRVTRSPYLDPVWARLCDTYDATDDDLAGDDDVDVASTWCVYCDAPIVPEHEVSPDSGTFCVCSPEDTYSPDDAAFLRYLRSR
jgi:hypothetical protein